MFYDTRDAGFYEAVHQIMEKQRTETSDRRGGERLPFGFVQLIAPITSGQLPDQSHFRHVHCQDLSAGGFSYYVDAVPEYTHLVVALGAVPFTFLYAQVMHSKPVELDGEEKYLIGCRFTGRITS